VSLQLLCYFVADGAATFSGAPLLLVVAAYKLGLLLLPLILLLSLPFDCCFEMLLLLALLLLLLGACCIFLQFLIVHILTALCCIALRYKMLSSIVPLCCAPLPCIVLCSTALHRVCYTALHRIVLHCHTFHRAPLWFIALFCIGLHNCTSVALRRVPPG